MQSIQFNTFQFIGNDNSNLLVDCRDNCQMPRTSPHLTEMFVNIPEQGLLLTSACRCCSQFSLLCASQTPCHRWTLSRTCRTWGPGSCHEPSSDGSLVSRSSCNAYGRSRRRGRSQGKFGSRAWSHYRPRHWRKGGLQQSGWWRSRSAGIQAYPSWLKWPGEKVMWHKKNVFKNTP